jgi:hypothetical protein
MEQNPFAYISLAIGGLIISILLFRWILGIDRHLKNQKVMIALLMLLCQKHGITDDELQVVRNAHEVS